MIVEACKLILGFDQFEKAQVIMLVQHLCEPPLLLAASVDCVPTTSALFVTLIRLSIDKFHLNLVKISGPMLLIKWYLHDLLNNN